VKLIAGVKGARKHPVPERIGGVELNRFAARINCLTTVSRFHVYESDKGINRERERVYLTGSLDFRERLFVPSQNCQ